jgi:hypothetical protein
MREKSLSELIQDALKESRDYEHIRPTLEEWIDLNSRQSVAFYKGPKQRGNDEEMMSWIDAVDEPYANARAAWEAFVRLRTVESERSFLAALGRLVATSKSLMGEE